MSVSFTQPSFSAGEIAPSLYARVDLAKYHVAAQLLRNMFVWPHGGVSNRAGTEFVGRAKDSTNPVHLIPFQFSIVQTYVLEFGHLYMRVIMNGGYVLEPAVAITAVSNANPGTVTAPNHGYSNGDQVFIQGTGLLLDSTPGRQYLVQNVQTNTFTLTDLDGNAINTTNYGTYGGSGGNVARVYTLATPYNGVDVQQLKWTQSADTMTLCHSSYPPMDLTRTAHWAWTLTEVSFAPTVSAPTNVAVTADAQTPTPLFHYAYVVTGVTLSPPDESYASAVAKCMGTQIRSDTGAFNTISWGQITGAVMYRVYKANPTVNEPIPDGAMFGYIGTATGTSFVDTEIAPDFTQAPPQGTNPFNAGPIATVEVTNGGSGYPNGNPPSGMTLSANDTTGSGAVLVPNVSGGVIQSVGIQNGGQNYSNPTIMVANQGAGAIGHINVFPGTSGQVVTATITNGGQDYYGKVGVTVAAGTGCTFQAVITNGVITKVKVQNAGNASGYVDGAALTFTQHGGTGATFSVSVAPSGNYPSCATYFQQRKVFAGSLANPQTIWMTRPADFKNMDVSNPSQANDAIVATIVSNQVNAIKSLVPMNDLVILTAGGVWRMIGGAIYSPVAVTPSNLTVVPQTYIGATDLPPIVVNYDILYVQAKGSIVRDLAYNYWVNVYTGNDMSILSNHLFFGHTLQRWAYAEQPFYQVWAVRDDGILLSFTYLKEQDVYAWAHSDSPGNSGTDIFLSVASIPEQQVPGAYLGSWSNATAYAQGAVVTYGGNCYLCLIANTGQVPGTATIYWQQVPGVNMDSVYFVVQRSIPGINQGQPVKYIERMNSRNFLTNGAPDVTKAWFVDCGLQYSSNVPTTVVSGLDHLNGAKVSILADGSVMPQATVVSGQIYLQAPATRVTVGLPFVSQLQTLQLTPEGAATQALPYRKKISAVTLRLVDTRGLKVGPSFNDLEEMKERSANVNMGVAIPLIEGDERIMIDNRYQVDNCVCIQQDQPLPCTILGVIPEMTIGDTPG